MEYISFRESGASQLSDPKYITRVTTGIRRSAFQKPLKRVFLNSLFKIVYSLISSVLNERRKMQRQSMETVFAFFLHFLGDFL